MARVPHLAVMRLGVELEGPVRVVPQQADAPGHCRRPSAWRAEDVVEGVLVHFIRRTARGPVGRVREVPGAAAVVIQEQSGADLRREDAGMLHGLHFFLRESRPANGRSGVTVDQERELSKSKSCPNAPFVKKLKDYFPRRADFVIAKTPRNCWKCFIVSNTLVWQNQFFRTGTVGPAQIVAKFEKGIDNQKRILGPSFGEF